MEGQIDGGTAEACDAALTDSLAGLVAQQLLPMVPELLAEEKPIPVWALKVVEECLESLPATTISALERCPCRGIQLCVSPAPRCAAWPPL